jgi:hypothetical protein
MPKHEPSAWPFPDWTAAHAARDAAAAIRQHAGPDWNGALAIAPVPVNENRYARPATLAERLGEAYRAAHPAPEPTPADDAPDDDAPTPDEPNGSRFRIVEPLTGTTLGTVE